MATERDYYTILGVPRDANDAEIKRAFRKLAQQWHPDVNKDDGADERFKEINEAYQVLSDPQKRQAYNMFGKAGVGGAGGAGGPGFEGFQDFGFGDIFDAFFGAAAQQQGGRSRARPNAGSDLRYDLKITFEEAIKGTEKEIEFSLLDRCATCSGSGAKAGTEPIVCSQCSGRGEIRSVRQTMLGQMVNVSACPKCRGEGKIVEQACETCRGDGRTQRTKKLRVNIPAGIDDGHQVRLANEGEVGARGGPSGSLFVAVHVAQHPQLKRDGTELYYGLEIGIAQAALGTKVRVPVVDGEEELEIKAGTQPGTELKLRGKGAPALRRPGFHGDLHVLVDVVVPSKLSKRQREILEMYATESGEVVSEAHGGLFDRVRDALG
jgi:molecular chaperone DnaJ